MNVTDAAYATMHDYPGGSAALAPRLGTCAAVLNSKVNPNTKTHGLMLAEADALIGITGDMRIVQALAAEHGFALVPIGSAMGSNATALELVLDAHGAEGLLAGEIRRAVADGHITPNELRAIERAGSSAQAAVLVLLRKLRTMSNAARPVCAGVDAS